MSVKTFVLRGLMALLLVVVLGGCFGDDLPETVERVGVGDRLPEMVLRMNDGTVVDNRSMLGRPVMVVLFSAVCGDCRKELPEVERAYRMLPSESDVMVIAISRGEGERQVAALWEELGLTMPYSAQEDRKVYELFANQGVPRIYIVDREGRIVAAYGDRNMPTAEMLLEALSRIK